MTEEQQHLMSVAFDLVTIHGEVFANNADDAGAVALLKKHDFDNKLAADMLRIFISRDQLFAPQYRHRIAPTKKWLLGKFPKHTDKQIGLFLAALYKAELFNDPLQNDSSQTKKEFFHSLATANSLNDGSNIRKSFDQYKDSDLSQVDPNLKSYVIGMLEFEGGDSLKAKKFFAVSASKRK